MSDGFYYRSGPKDVTRVPIASGTVIEVGDLLKLSSGRAAKMATTTDNLTFLGVAAEAHRAVDPSGDISVYPPNGQTAFEYPLDAATDIVYGAPLQWNAAQALKGSSTDPIATAVRAQLQATKVWCVFRLNAVSASLGDIGDAS